MSDANLLNPPVIEWACNGATYKFAPCDLEIELLFQSAHERWAINRLETIKGGVSPSAYEAMVNKLAEQVASNRFAFGGTLSWHFLFTSAGTMEYLSLLSKKARTPCTVKTLDAFRRSDKDGWDKLWDRVLERDLPNPKVVEDTSSEDGETQSPSTTESSLSSVGSPG